MRVLFSIAKVGMLVILLCWGTLGTAILLLLTTENVVAWCTRLQELHPGGKLLIMWIPLWVLVTGLVGIIEVALYGFLTLFPEKKKVKTDVR